ncbi:hypothetical protein [Ralstonia solanacearum]|uniref:hypothetical protein n=1 Tax=Ralstonia solanacearum TaxID=305 RepID=UPI001E602325|nr:hypothetical protein [Ralstonia solanacearum]
MNLNEDGKRSAFNNIVAAGDFKRMLPESILSDAWTVFLFFQSDYVFSSDFVEIIYEFLHLEDAHVACLLNLDKTEILEFDSAAAIYIDEKVDRSAYQEKLHAGGPALGWLFGIDRYVCASDVGEWCIYCEKSNDVAVIAFRGVECIKKFEMPLRNLSARPIEDLIDGGCAALFPFDQLVPAWRKGLVDNYGHKERSEGQG